MESWFDSLQGQELFLFSIESVHAHPVSCTHSSNYGPNILLYREHVKHTSSVKIKLENFNLALDYSLMHILAASVF